MAICSAHLDTIPQTYVFGITRDERRNNVFTSQLIIECGVIFYR